jgi:hypothetical protein
MRTEFVSCSEVEDKVKASRGGNRHTKVALVAASWQRGRKLLDGIKGGDGTDVQRDFAFASVQLLPGPGCIHGDFLAKNEFDELYVVPDGMSLIDIHRLTKVLLGTR